mmetsp:Transcript_87855/g.179477  ORF Transcript_87855/g.179477 Transcript_87855/m.179477 type:complete len:95 (-) Transcript_87855:306-590(-)
MQTCHGCECLCIPVPMSPTPVLFVGIDWSMFKATLCLKMFACVFMRCMEMNEDDAMQPTCVNAALAIWSAVQFYVHCQSSQEYVLHISSPRAMS